jgi:hypothetical protein
MTLIAGFQHEGIPLLLGDFLLTSDGQRSGLRKKINLISPNFVIAWTGHLLAAKSVIDSLNREFQGRRTSRNGIHNFLTKYAVSDLGNLQVHLIGWVVDSEPSCFLWNSSYPHELFYSDYHIDGSGTKIFERLFASVGITDTESSSESRILLANQFALFLACELISDEVLQGNNQRMGFGHAYEVLYFDGDEFIYLDNITYMTWDFNFDLDSKLTRTNLYKVVFKYRNFGDFSIVQISNFENSHTDLHAITPVIEIERTSLEAIID